MPHAANMTEANAILHRMAGRGPVKAVLWELHRLLPGFSRNRLIEIWKRDERARVVDDEVMALRVALAERLKQEEVEARRVRLEILDRIASIEAALLASDPDMAGPQINAFRQSVGLRSRVHRTMVGD